MGYDSFYEFETGFVISAGKLLTVNNYDNSKSKDASLSDEELGEFIYQNINWDKLPELDTISNRIIVIVNFVVDSLGNADSLSVNKEGLANFDAEAVRVIGEVPNWSVLYNRGKIYQTNRAIGVIFSRDRREKYYR